MTPPLLQFGARCEDLGECHLVPRWTHLALRVDVVGVLNRCRVRGHLHHALASGPVNAPACAHPTEKFSIAPQGRTRKKKMTPPGNTGHGRAPKGISTAGQGCPIRPYFRRFPGGSHRFRAAPRSGLGPPLAQRHAIRQRDNRDLYIIHLYIFVRIELK